jgi:hypothetical protein
MAVKYIIPKSDGTTYEIKGWDEDKLFLAVLIHKENQRIRNYDCFKTFAGAKSRCARWGYGVDVSTPTEREYVTIVKGELV